MSQPRETARSMLLAARELFSLEGFDSTSVAEIVNRVGVVEGATVA